MKINGNTFAGSFVYTPDRDASELHYGNNPLLYLGDSYNGTSLEIGYNPTYVDQTTRFLFYTPEGISGLTHLSDPTLVYMPSLSSGIDDVPTATNPDSMSWVTDDTYGTVLRMDGSIGSGWNLGPRHKSVWIDPQDSFLIEAIVKPSLKLSTQRVANLGYTTAPYFNNGCTLNIHTYTSLTFGWGAGNTAHTLNGTITVDEWQHVAVLWSKANDRITLYRNGVELDHVDSPNAMYQYHTWSGLASFVALEEFDGDAAMVKVSVGEFTPANFGYHFYIKDNENNSQVVYRNLVKDVPHAIYMDYTSGARDTHLQITNSLSEDLFNYSVRVDTSVYTNADAVSFEQLDGSPLSSMEYEGIFFVKIPRLPANDSVTIKLVEGESTSLKPRNIGNVSRFNDDMYNPVGGYNPQKWVEVSEDLSFLANYSYIHHIENKRMMGATMYETGFLNDGVRLEEYLMANPGFAYTGGYRLLFRQGRVTTDAGTISGVFGVCVEAEMYSGFASCLNFFIDDQEGTRDYGGSFAHADWKNYHKGALGTQAANVTNNSAQFILNSFEVTVNASTDELVVTNLTAGESSSAIDLSSEIPGYSNTRGYFGFVWGNEGFNYDNSFTSYYLSDVVALDYVNNEPTVTELNSINKKHEFRLYIDGVQQL